MFCSRLWRCFCCTFSLWHSADWLSCGASSGHSRKCSFWQFNVAAFSSSHFAVTCHHVNVLAVTAWLASAVKMDISTHTCIPFSLRDLLCLWLACAHCVLWLCWLGLGMRSYDWLRQSIRVSQSEADWGGTYLHHPREKNLTAVWT